MGSVAYLAHAQTVDSTIAAGVGAGAGENSGIHEPFSRKASNIGAGDTTSYTAPALPDPSVGDDAPVSEYLRAAHNALVAGRLQVLGHGDRGRALEISAAMN
jgi:hypothetical protein